jgi:hypothetical protein
VIRAERAAQVPDNHDNTPIVFWERIAPIGGGDLVGCGDLPVVICCGLP